MRVQADRSHRQGGSHEEGSRNRECDAGWFCRLAGGAGLRVDRSRLRRRGGPVQQRACPGGRRYGSSGSVADEVQALKAKPGGTMAIYASPKLVHSFIDLRCAAELTSNTVERLFLRDRASASIDAGPREVGDDDHDGGQE